MSYETFKAAYAMGAIAHGATREQAEQEAQIAWKEFCGCKS
jgi:predicted RNase H-like HicB family nuclease